MSTPGIPPSGEYPHGPFKELSAYYNSQVPIFEDRVRDAQKQLDQMKVAQQVVNAFTEELGGYVWLSNKPDERTAGMIFGSGLALVGMAHSVSPPSTSIFPASASILASGVNSNVASLAVGFQSQWPGSFPKTLDTLAAYNVPLQSIAESLRQAIEMHVPECLDRATALIDDLEASTHSDRYGNAGKNVRELLRLLYYHYAPDAIVLKWPKVKLDEKKRPTRKSRLNFGPFGMYPPELYPSDYSANVELIVNRLVEKNDELNRLTHSEGASDSLQARPILNTVVSDMLTWLELVNRGRELRALHVQELFEEQLDNLMDDVIPELEEGYSHVFDIEPYADTIQVVREDAEAIEVAGKGTIRFTGQMGSNSDVRNGDGLEGKCKRTFDFRCSMRWEAPNEIELPENSLVLEEENWE
jgi:hypothetical protein